MQVCCFPPNIWCFKLIVGYVRNNYFCSFITSRSRKLEIICYWTTTCFPPNNIGRDTGCENCHSNLHLSCCCDFRFFLVVGLLQVFKWSCLSYPTALSHLILNSWIVICIDYKEKYKYKDFGIVCSNYSLSTK